jgi:acetate kinase
VIERLSTFAASEVDAIGHLTVHGGKYFQNAVLVDDEVVKRIEALSHQLLCTNNPPGAQGIRIVSELFPNKTQSCGLRYGSS